MHTITRILATIALAATVLVGAPVAAQADTGTCDPGEFYTLTVRLADAEAEVNELERQLRRQADQHADDLDDVNELLLAADQRAIDQTNRHAQEVADLFSQIDDARAATRAAEANALEEADERLDAERQLARADARIARLVAKVAALKATR